MRDMCIEALSISESYFRQLETFQPPPQWAPWENAYNWRYVEKLPTQVILQKLARNITGLKALDLLLTAGFLQEVGVLFRMLDEISEDVYYISIGLANDKWTSDHQKYVEYFWSEDEDDHMPPVRRSKIRAFVNRSYHQPDPSSADRVERTIHKTFSDYIHARSAPIMSMISGPPARFHLEGIRDQESRRSYIEQMPSYYYRGLASVCVAAKVCAPAEVSDACYREVKSFEERYRRFIF